MRKYTEVTARNLLRKPLIFGVPLMGLILLSFVVLTTNLVGGQGKASSLTSLAIALLGYAILRGINRIARNGWEESLLFRIEKLLNRKHLQRPEGRLRPATIDSRSADTLDVDDLVASREDLREWLRDIGANESRSLIGLRGTDGLEIYEVDSPGLIHDLDHFPHAYSLHQLPVASDPLWLNSTLNRLPGNLAICVRFTGLDFWKTKGRIEASRRSNARDSTQVSNIDSEVTFEESSRVLEGLSRGEEKLYEASLIILSDTELDLDPELFCKETDNHITVRAITGERKRAHRSYIVRECTATDLIPNLQDPKETGTPVLQTRRGLPLYFSPLDTRLEALHWLVVGASGSGKSFFTGLILNRIMEQGEQISVLFVDHNRSFRRIVRSKQGPYIEPSTLAELERKAPHAISFLNLPGTVAGIELSDLNLGEKKEAAHYVLSQIEAFLRSRDTTHPVYVVLDECWNFMRDEPVLVQRAFREFRKLNGAAVAITQSLADFLTDEAGQSIYQNAPIRILLRQGEDVSRYQGILGLNAREISLVKTLQQRKGVFSECLIKTPFLSRLGRLYPSESEHALLRTDNLRQEMLEEIKSNKARGVLCV